MNIPENSGQELNQSSCKAEQDHSGCKHEHSQGSKQEHSSCEHETASNHAQCQHNHSAEQEQRSRPSSAELGAHAKESAFSKVVGMMDIAGVIASTLCMVHCLLLPIIVALLPVLAKPLMKEDWVHMSLAGFVLVFCLIAYIPGYLQHRDRRLIYVGCIGLTLVFFATFVARAWGEVVEAAIITAGNTVIIFGHMLNRRRLAHLKCKHKYH